MNLLYETPHIGLWVHVHMESLYGTSVPFLVLTICSEPELPQIRLLMQPLALEPGFLDFQEELFPSPQKSPLSFLALPCRQFMLRQGLTGYVELCAAPVSPKLVAILFLGLLELQLCASTPRPQWL